MILTWGNTSRIPLGCQFIGNDMKAQTTPKRLIIINNSIDPIWQDTTNSLNNKRQQLLKLASVISTIDQRTEAVIKPLRVFSNGFRIEPLGNAGCQPCHRSKILIFGLESCQSIVNTISAEYVIDALTIFAWQEISHVWQGFREYSDVRKMKAITGSEEMGKYDLTSDFLAVNTLSLLHTLQQAGSYNEEVYIENFYKLWCDLGGKLLNAFPAGQNPVKQQRVFGNLLMANLTTDAYLRGNPLPFNSSLWPKWSDSLDQLIIFGKNNNIWMPPCEVEPTLMKAILNAIAIGEYSAASILIQDLSKS